MGIYTGHKFGSLISIAVIAAITLSACQKKEEKAKLEDVVAAEPVTVDGIVGHWKSDSQDMYITALDSSGSGTLTFTEVRGQFPFHYRVVSGGKGARSVRIETIGKDGQPDHETFAVGNHGKTLFRDDEIGTVTGPIPIEYTYVDDKTSP